MAKEEMIASREEMAAARLPLGSRDLCANKLIPLNKCRVESFYLPWKCEEERHSYERCEYQLFLQRLRKMEALREAREVAVAQRHALQ
ncbi:hypothetical protein O6H91_13G089900 [Diphasiastrum complanatum]|uniref:Uncharacterized protein n=3 Tax=Diphasiastrum complanatum TaxID=34168 RepID=A0ACC2BXJ0_DIPCM|nr:hypothetical protein O6H91_Y102300 [Diphasiastrum complanatum]KAJ7534283.1 hypothetical protein O6H91_13G087700 [Diphasiastrum complanatum]KAJ7534334.1 hypothetical protein O6H91_13G089600 [Diphasiastrum complanatum]KAJ7534338.1 hypothetical protein O6H91_13G089900 [Diphasiastrum complanatum]